MSTDGTRVAIGAHHGGVGHVRVYAESGGLDWQVAVDIDGEALVQDGTRVIGGSAFFGNEVISLNHGTAGTWGLVALSRVWRRGTCILFGVENEQVCAIATLGRAPEPTNRFWTRHGYEASSDCTNSTERKG